MARFLKKRDQNKGLAPGSLVFIGEQKIDHPLIRLIDFDSNNLSESVLASIADGQEYVGKNSVTWINIDGLHDTELIRETGRIFKLHPLLLEDLLNTGQRPKFEEFDDCLFFTCKMLRYDKEINQLHSEQLSLVLGETYLITFQERKGDVFEPVRDRIRKSKGRVRISGVDYLAYALLDTIVDNYIQIIEEFGEQIENLEDRVLTETNTDTTQNIFMLKREMNFMRKMARPVKEAINGFLRSESELKRDDTHPFLKDLLDLITHAVEAIDTYQEILSDQLNMNNAIMSNKMNDIMRTLTVFAAIFIPLTFIAGVYGTNFKFLPELEFRYSYFIFWGVLVSIGGAMMVYFKRKDWF